MTTVSTGPRALSGALILVFTAVTGLGVAFTAQRASAVYSEITETGTLGYLTLARASSTPLWATLKPGESMRWLIQASLHDASNSELAVELRGEGELVEAAGLTGSIDVCSGSFDPTTLACSGTLTPALDTEALRDQLVEGNRVKLADLTQGAPRDLLVTITLPDTAEIAAGTSPSARVGLGVHAAGTDGRVDPPRQTEVPGDPKLPVTGSDLLPLGLLATGLVGLGAALSFRRRVTR